MERRRHTEIRVLRNDFSVTQDIDRKSHHKTFPEDLQAPHPDHVRRSRTRTRKDHECRLEDSLFQNELPLSKDTNYVRQWLLEADAVINQPDHPTSRSLNMPSSCDKVSKGRVFAKNTGMRSAMSTGFEAPRKEKLDHGLSSDSSLLDPLPEDRITDFLAGPECDEIKSQDGFANHKHRPKHSRHPSDTESRQSSTILPQKKMFEKRPRHKTREDRYEPVRKERVPKDERERGSKRLRKSKRTIRNKVKNAASEGLLHTFSSKSIGQERLTILPHCGPGLFMNGRASSPVARRGIPDLAFSEMEFLQHSSRRRAPPDEHEKPSKSRERGATHLSSNLDDVSEKAQLSRLPLTTSNHNSYKIPISGGERYSHSQEDRYESEGVSYHILSSASALNHKMDDNLESDLRERPCTIDAHLRSGLSYRKSNSYGARSDGAKSYISWSETYHSPGRATMQSSIYNSIQSTTKSTPKRIQKSIEATGIFRYTGIPLSSTLSDHMTTTVPPVRIVEILPGVIDSAEAHILQDEIASNWARKGQEKNKPKKAAMSTVSAHQQATEVSNKETTFNSSSQLDELRKAEHDNTIEQDNQVPKTLKRPHLTKYETISSFDSRSDNLSLSRDRIAKHARVKRPSTTIPLQRSVNMVGSVEADEMAKGHKQSQGLGEVYQDCEPLVQQFHLEGSKQYQVGRECVVSTPECHDDSGPQVEHLIYRAPNDSSTAREGGEEVLTKPLAHSGEQNLKSSDSALGKPPMTGLGFPFRGSRGSQKAFSVPRQCSRNESLPLYIRQMQHATTDERPSSIFDHAAQYLLLDNSNEPEMESDLLPAYEYHTGSLRQSDCSRVRFDETVENRSYEVEPDTEVIIEEVIQEYPMQGEQGLGYSYMLAENINPPSQYHNDQLRTEKMSASASIAEDNRNHDAQRALHGDSGDGLKGFWQCHHQY